MFRLTLLCFLLTGNGNREEGQMLSRSSSWSRRRRRSWLPVATSAAHVACATRNGLQWAGLGCSGCRSRQRNLDLFSRVSSLPSPVWGLFLFLFRQHRRQHCYCLLMHYFALFSCGRQRQQQVAGRWRCPSLAVGVRAAHESLFLRSLW